MKPVQRRPRGGQDGFVLVLTLMVLVAIAIAATFFAESVQKSLQLATLRQDTNDALIELSDARAEALFRLATTPATLYGLGSPPNVVRLDGRPYGVGRTTLQLQDGGGLFNVGVFSDEQMLRFLTVAGVPADKRAGLIDALRDYVDEDDFVRLNGAERAQYAARGLAGLPRNAPLVSPLELRQVLGWRDLPELRQGSRQLLDLTTVGTSLSINPNTASWQVLTMLPGVTEEMAKAIIEHRLSEPANVGWMDRMFGTQLDSMISAADPLPSDNIRITQSAQGLTWGLRYNIKLTPRSTIAPWTVTYFYRLEKESATSPPWNAGKPPNASDPPSLPPRSALPASSAQLLSN